MDGDVIIRNFQLIERDTNPAFGLSALPGVDKRHTRNIDIKSRDLRKRSDSIGCETVFFAGLIENALQAAGIFISLDNECPGIERGVLHLERLCSRMHFELAVLEDERGQRVIRVVIDEECLCRAAFEVLRASGDCDIFHQIHGDLEDFCLLHPDSFDVVERAESPARVIVGPGIIGVEILTVEHHIRHS